MVHLLAAAAAQAKPVVVQVPSDPSLADWITVGVGAFTALATALAAYAALRAAKASERTSREAREALAAALEPALTLQLDMYTEADEGLDAPERLWLRVTNVDRLASATDLEVNARFADGKNATVRRDLLRPFAGGDDWFAPLRTVSDTWPPLDFEPVAVSVQYSDGQGAARHELTMEARVKRDDVEYDGEEGTHKRRLK